GPGARHHPGGAAGRGHRLAGAGPAADRALPDRGAEHDDLGHDPRDVGAAPHPGRGDPAAGRPRHRRPGEAPAGLRQRLPGAGRDRPVQGRGHARDDADGPGARGAGEPRPAPARAQPLLRRRRPARAAEELRMTRWTLRNVVKVGLVVLFLPLLAFLVLVIGAVKKRALVILEGLVYAAGFAVGIFVLDVIGLGGLLALVSMGASGVRAWHLRDLWLPARRRWWHRLLP